MADLKYIGDFWVDPNRVRNFPDGSKDWALSTGLWAELTHEDIEQFNKYVEFENKLTVIRTPCRRCGKQKPLQKIEEVPEQEVPQPEHVFAEVLQNNVVIEKLEDPLPPAVPQNS